MKEDEIRRQLVKVEIKAGKRRPVCVGGLEDGPGERERDEERAAEGKLHSEVISLKDSIRPSEVSIVHTRTRTHACTYANTGLEACKHRLPL